MSSEVKRSKISLMDLSRIALEVDKIHYDDDSTAVNNRDELAKIGAIQRIADSLEKIASVLYRIEDKMPDENSYKYKTQVTKLSARLKKAGLDSNPESDGRGRKNAKARN